MKKKRFSKPRAKRLNRSMAGNTLLFVLMGICGVAMAIPLVMVINNCERTVNTIKVYGFENFSCKTNVIRGIILQKEVS